LKGADGIFEVKLGHVEAGETLRYHQCMQKDGGETATYCLRRWKTVWKIEIALKEQKTSSPVACYR